MSFPSFPPRPNSSGRQPFPSHVDRNSTLGQVAFAPATQTTVVTTTTTTTTKFPPFVLRPPRRTRDLDTKLYPLAAVPTPPALKKVCFEVDGTPTVFHEADDAPSALKKLQREQESLDDAHGEIRNVHRFHPHFSTELEPMPNPFAAPDGGERDQPFSPESITEDDDPQSGSTTVREERTSNRSVQTSSRRKTSAPSGVLPRLRSLRSSDPLTPHTGSRRSRRRVTQEEEATDDGDNSVIVSRRGNPRRTPQSLPAQSAHSLSRTQSNLQYHCTPHNAGHSPPGASNPHHQEDHEVPTPPVDGAEPNPFTRPASRSRNLSSLPARLNMLEPAGILDGSLPSPSLSPVTAAATTSKIHGFNAYFADVDSNSDIASQQGHEMLDPLPGYAQTPSRSRFGSPFLPGLGIDYADASTSLRFSGASIDDIPAMLDYFEAIPDELKSYVMHQLLRRCPKPTLQVVADAVNPALKCDFLSTLPPELALNVLRFLDLKSLCKASQVSKKWREMINGDEEAWKELFDTDGFNLPEGELQQSITEGWGWQDPHGSDGYEQDISAQGLARAESENVASGNLSSANGLRLGSGAISRRPKRKAATKLSNRSKHAKKMSSRETTDEVESIDWMSLMSNAEGPYNAASAATLAVPYPNSGLPALKSLHLYKSLYRRHHLIRKNWMREDAKPHHIAFRAHDRHVVTCLQFDTDKILTGSDDNNINVYDTKTGALRVKLQGHEGGVWALQYEGNVLVSGSTDRSVRVWDINKGREMQVFRGHTSTVRCLQILSPTKIGETADGKPIMAPKRPLIITGSRDSNLRIWRLPPPEDPPYIQPESSTDDSENPYFVRTLAGHQHSVRAIAAYADTLVSGSYDCTIRVWKISTGETVHRLQGHTAKVYSVVLDHERNRCISGSMDNLVKIWSLDTGSILHTLDGHSSLVGLLDLNADRLVSAAADSTLRIWDPENGQCKATLSAHTGAITCFQHDAQKVISGSDRTLKMWNVKTGECVRDLLMDLSGVWQVRFNERRCVAAVQRDNMTYIEVLDFGAARDGVPESKRGRRIVVDAEGKDNDRNMNEDENAYLDLDGSASVDADVEVDADADADADADEDV